MGDLKDSERVSSLVLLGLLDFLQSGASMKRPFDILKKTDVVNFKWVEAVRDLQTAEARILELETHSPGDYVVFSQRTQQIVARSKALMAGA
jgi:hypothetical protein